MKYFHPLFVEKKFFLWKLISRIFSDKTHPIWCFKCLLICRMMKQWFWFFLLCVLQIWKGLGEVLTVLCLWQGKIFFFFFEEIWNKFFKRAAVLNHSWFVEMSEINFIWFSVCWIYTYYSYFFKIALTLLILCIPILIFFWKENNLILPDVWMICTSFSKHGLRKDYYMSCYLKIYFFKVNRF